MDEEMLAGGIANAGAVVRVGEGVLRPSSPHREAIHALLRHVRARGFDGAPEVWGIEPDGRERLVFIEGDVPLPAFPQWSQTDAVLASTVQLLRTFHAATIGFEALAGAGWSDGRAGALHTSARVVREQPPTVLGRLGLSTEVEICR